MRSHRLRNIACLCTAGVGLLLAGCLMPGEAVDANQAAQQGGQLKVAARPLNPQPGAEVGTTLLLTWTPVSGATHYEVYLGLDTLPPLIADVDNTSLQVRDLPECMPHYWRVVARDDDGNLLSSPTWQFDTRCQ